jgi:hypothetical protein
VLTRLFMTGYEPVDFIAAAPEVKLSTDPPVFNGGQLLLEFNWSKAQLIYFCKLIILVIIVLVAVLNYRTYVSEKEEN